MEEGDAQGVSILLERTWQETADHRAFRDESSMRAGRQMRAVTHHRTDVAHVDLPDCEVAFPAHYVDGIEGVDDFRDLVVHLNAYLPFVAVVEQRRGLGCDNGGRIIQSVLGEEAFVRLLELVLGLND